MNIIILSKMNFRLESQERRSKEVHAFLLWFLDHSLGSVKFKFDCDKFLIQRSYSNLEEWILFSNVSLCL